MFLQAFSFPRISWQIDLEIVKQHTLSRLDLSDKKYQSTLVCSVRTISTKSSPNSVTELVPSGNNLFISDQHRAPVC